MKLKYILRSLIWLLPYTVLGLLTFCGVVLKGFFLLWALKWRWHFDIVAGVFFDYRKVVLL